MLQKSPYPALQVSNLRKTLLSSECSTDWAILAGAGTLNKIAEEGQYCMLSRLKPLRIVSAQYFVLSALSKNWRNITMPIQHYEEGIDGHLDLRRPKISWRAGGPRSGSDWASGSNKNPKYDSNAKFNLIYFSFTAKLLPCNRDAYLFTRACAF